jgi:DNA-binding LytR/AlgR family response regulator
MTSYRILIVEQDSTHISQLKKALKAIGHQVVGVAKTPTQAIRIYQCTSVDLALIAFHSNTTRYSLQLGTYFYQVTLPFVYLVEKLSSNLLVAANGTHPCNYITRPYRINDLKATITLSMNTFSPQESTINSRLPSISTKRGIIYCDDILFIQAEHVYTRIFLSNGTSILQRQSLKTVLDQLPKHLFVQTHRSYVVHIQRVERMQSERLYIGQHQIPLSRQRRKLVQQCVKNRAAT